MERSLPNPEEAVRTFFSLHDPEKSCGRVMVACSGGVDSVALAALLHFGGVKDLVLAHVCHGIRSAADGERDRQVVETLARRLNCSLLVETIEPGQLEQRSRETGESLEAVARHERYRRLLSMARPDPLKTPAVVATAHHMDDQAETVLMRLLSGRPILECSGISPVLTMQGVRFVRPLLGFTHTQLKAYAQAKDLAWNEDETNDDTRFLRNLFRREILPHLERFVPDVVGAIARRDEELRLLHEALQALLPEPLRSSSPQEELWSVPAEPFESVSPVIREQILRERIHEIAPGDRLNGGIVTELLRQSARKPDIEISVQGQGVELFRREGRYGVRRVVPTLESGYLVEVPSNGGLRVLADGSFSLVDGIPDGGWRFFIEPASYPVVVRGPRREDYQTPGGPEAGAAERKGAIVLEDQDGVLAILHGHRTLVAREGAAFRSGDPGARSCVRLDFED